MSRAFSGRPAGLRGEAALEGEAHAKPLDATIVRRLWVWMKPYRVRQLLAFLAGRKVRDPGDNRQVWRP